jgi:hypothetical protein
MPEFCAKFLTQKVRLHRQRIDTTQQAVGAPGIVAGC